MEKEIILLPSEISGNGLNGNGLGGNGLNGNGLGGNGLSGNGMSGNGQNVDFDFLQDADFEELMKDFV